jgi:hypothetical protein
MEEENTESEKFKSKAWSWIKNNLISLSGSLGAFVVAIIMCFSHGFNEEIHGWLLTFPFAVGLIFPLTVLQDDRLLEKVPKEKHTGALISGCFLSAEGAIACVAIFSKLSTDYLIYCYTAVLAITSIVAIYFNSKARVQLRAFAPLAVLTLVLGIVGLINPFTKKTNTDTVYFTNCSITAPSLRIFSGSFSVNFNGCKLTRNDNDFFIALSCFLLIWISVLAIVASLPNHKLIGKIYDFFCLNQWTSVLEGEKFFDTQTVDTVHSFNPAQWSDEIKAYLSTYLQENNETVTKSQKVLNFSSLASLFVSVFSFSFFEGSNQSIPFTFFMALSLYLVFSNSFHSRYWNRLEAVQRSIDKG